MKPFEEWTFEDLCTHTAWDVIQGITRGDSLKTIMWKVCSITIQWRDEQIKQQKKEKKK